MESGAFVFNPSILLFNSKLAQFQKRKDFYTVKQFTIILALFMLLKPILPLVEYVVLYDYIRTELCVNKSKPELKCNGKCHLAKELKNASDSKEEGTNKKHFSVESHIAFCQEINEELVENLFITAYKSNINVGHETFHSQSNLNTVFRPPIFI